MAAGVSKTLAAAGLLALCVGPGCYSGLDGDASSIGGESAGADGADDGADDGGDGGDDGADDGPDGVPDDFEPSPGSMRRLTAEQYRNSIRDVFGVDIEEDLDPPVELDLDETSAMFPLDRSLLRRHLAVRGREVPRGCIRDRDRGGSPTRQANRGSPVARRPARTTPASARRS